MPYISIGRKGLSDELNHLKKSDIEDQYLESWELKEVLSIVRKYNKQYARIFEFQALTGMRIGEVLGLKEEAIDFNKNMVIKIEELIIYICLFRDERYYSSNIYGEKNVTTKHQRAEQVLKKLHSLYKE